MSTNLHPDFPVVTENFVLTKGWRITLPEEFNRRIEDGSLPTGARLPTEVDIMRMLGVGRSAVREAMSHLQAAGLVETRHGVGTFVLAPCNAAALLELRIGLEADAAALAAERRSDAQLAQLGAACADDVAFHLVIAASTGNRYFHDILNHLGTNIIPRARLNSAKLAHDDPAVYMERVIHEHEDIFNAIRRQDPESARAAMRIHLSNSRERLRRAQEQFEGGVA